MDKKIHMGKTFNSHFGYVELPTNILQVGIFENHVEFECEDGIYKVELGCYPSEKLMIRKINKKES